MISAKSSILNVRQSSEHGYGQRTEIGNLIIVTQKETSQSLYYT